MEIGREREKGRDIYIYIKGRVRESDKEGGGNNEKGSVKEEDSINKS